MKHSSEILTYLSEIEKEIEETELTTKILVQELSALQHKQVSLYQKFSCLKDKFIHLLNNEQDYTKNMARELIKNDRKVIQLKNGQVNTPYHDQLILEEYSIPSDSALQFQGIQELLFINDKLTFEGTPVSSGEFTGSLSYLLAEGEAPIVKEVHFLVNPDPRSLWQENEPAADEPYPKPHKAFELLKANNKNIVAASLRGKSHAHKGTFRDDEFASKYFEEQGWVLQVLADGAGSAKYSRHGSKLACSCLVTHLEEVMKSDVLNKLESLIIKHHSSITSIANDELKTLVSKLTSNAAHKAHMSIAEHAAQNGYQTNEFATTLLFTLTKDFNFGSIVIHFSIGDGAIAAISNRAGTLLMKADGGEFSGQTCFLTEASIFDANNTNALNQRSGIHLYPQKIDYLFLMTDGVSDPKFGTENNLKNSENWIVFKDELKPILQPHNNIELELFNWLDFYIPGEYDDRTISILY